MISLINVSKSHGSKFLFDKINLTINRGEKIGLIGPNGAGKTTFFSIILGNEELSSGSIQINRNVRIGYLPQEANFDSKSSVLSELIEGDETILRLKKEKEKLEVENKAASKHYGEILHELEFLGYFDLEYKAKKILMGLEFKEKDFNRPISHMSGGWQMRVLLAKLLTCHYDVLLLDEPTNYLDLAAALWFKDYLAAFKGTFVMISHDIAFLNEVTNYTLVLEEGTISKVRGNYEDYQRTREEKRWYLLKQFKEQAKKREQLKKFISRFHGQPNKASQVRAKRKMLERIGEIAPPQNRRESIRSFCFPQARRSGYQVITLGEISKSYGDIEVYKNFDFEIYRGEKAVLVGENGAGKSTLLKILAGVIDIDKGTRSLGHNVDIGYFSQTRMDTLNSYNTVFEEACSAADGSILGEAVRTILGAFLFSGKDVEKSVSVLSGGEKSRLILAKLLINPPNSLLLDEPTTHLDADAVDALIKALSTYEGTLVFISHDIHFVRSVANIVFEVKQGEVRKFPGNFNDYWQKSKVKSAFEERKIESLDKEVKVDSLKNEKKQQRLLKKEEEKKRKVHNAALGKKIKELRNEKEKLEGEHYVKARILSNPRSYHTEGVAKEYGRRLKEIAKRLLEIDKGIEEFKQSFFN